MNGMFLENIVLCYLFQEILFIVCIVYCVIWQVLVRTECQDTAQLRTLRTMSGRLVRTVGGDDPIMSQESSKGARTKLECRQII